MASTSLLVERLSRVIRSYVRSVAPGLDHALNLYCFKFAGKECVTVLLEDPCLFRDILSGVYGSSLTLEVIARIYLRPLVEELGINRTVDELVNLLVDNPAELANLIRNTIKTNNKNKPQ